MFGLHKAECFIKTMPKNSWTQPLEPATVKRLAKYDSACLPKPQHSVAPQEIVKSHRTDISYLPCHGLPLTPQLQLNYKGPSNSKRILSSGNKWMFEKTKYGLLESRRATGKQVGGQMGDEGFTLPRPLLSKPFSKNQQNQRANRSSTNWLRPRCQAHQKAREMI